MMNHLPWIALAALSTAHAAEPGWVFQTIAKSADGHRMTSLKLDPGGRPMIAYTGCVDALCKQNGLGFATQGADGKFTARIIDSSTKDTGWFAHLEVDGAGATHVFYDDRSKLQLRHALKPAGGDFSFKTIRKTHGGYWNAGAVSPSGTVWIANTSFPNNAWDRPALELGSYASGAWNFETVDSTGVNVGWFPSVAIGADALPVVTYMTEGYPVGDLRMVRKLADGTWSREWIDRKAVKSSVAVGADGVVHVVYQTSFDETDSRTNLMYARSEAPGKWEIQMIEGTEEFTAETGYHPALVIDAAGGLHVFYREMKENCLKHASKALGGLWKSSCAGPRGSGGLYAGAAIDAQGRMHVAFDSSREIIYGVSTP